MPSWSLHSTECVAQRTIVETTYKKCAKEIHLENEAGPRNWAFGLTTVYLDLLIARWMSPNTSFNTFETWNGDFCQVQAST